MKRVVVKAETVSDIERQRDEARKRYLNQKSRYNSQRSEFQEKMDEVKDNIKDTILRKLNSAASPGFMKYVSIDVKNSLRDNFDIDVNYAYNNSGDKNISLRWQWSVTVSKDGTVDKESNSWSGIQATTPENIDNLKQSLEVMKVLVSIDDKEWYDILTTPSPKYEDYVTQDVDTFNESDYERRIDEAKLRNAIGTQTAFKLYDGNGEYYFKNSYVQIIRETPKRYTVVEWSGTGLDNDDGASSYNYSKPYQISKIKLLRYIEKPYKTIQVPEV